MSPGQIEAFLTKLGKASGTWGFENGSRYNVRVESLGTVWRNLQFQRGILTVDSFWEKEKQFAESNGQMLKIGVIYNDRAEFSVITRPADDVVSPYHHRMPLILDEHSCEEFLADKAPENLSFPIIKLVA